MSTAAPAATKLPQHDPARAAYQRSRNAEIWVHGYVLKMNVMPAKRFVRKGDNPSEFDSEHGQFGVGA